MIQFSLTKKFFKIFNQKEKYIFLLIILIQFLSSFLEILSIGSLLPIFKAVTDPSWNEKYFGFINEESRIAFIFILVIIIFIIKNLFLVGSAYLSGKFRNKVTLRMVREVYDSYLNKKYEFHINNHSSILLRNMSYIDSIASIFMRLVSFYSDLILTFMAFFVVLLVNFKITIIVFTFLILILSAYALLTKFTIEKYGKNTQNHNSSYLKNMMEGIKSYKEILLSGKQNFFSKRNKSYKEQALKYNLRFSIIELIPKYLIEIIFVIAVLVSIFYFVIYENIDLYEYLPFIGVMILGLLKFLPNLLRIFSSHQQFYYLLPVIDIINNTIFQIKEDSTYDLKSDLNNSISFKENIEFKNISFGYSNKLILDDINFSIKKNSVVGIRGESGAGKSTILNILTGLISPKKGKIIVDGIEQNLSTRSWQSKIGYVSQNTHLLDDTIKTNIAFGSDKIEVDEQLMNDCLKKSGLDDYIGSLTLGIDTIVGENGIKISGGQVQRIGIARAFYKKPEILILDEPTNSLDHENENKIIETLKKLKNKVTMIIVSHSEEPLEISDIKLLIKKGKIIS